MSAVRNGLTPGLGISRAAAVTEELRRMILSGELQAGERLRQVDLAARFQVSTTPVREAFTALTREGLVRHDPQRGVVVFTPTTSDVKENYEIRMALEPLAAEFAAKSISAADLERLDLVVKKMRKTRSAVDYQPLNREFHRIIYRAADRPRLFELIESLRDAFEAYIGYDTAARPDPGYNEAAHQEHEAIAAALAAHAPKRARKLMLEHLMHNSQHIEDSVKMTAPLP